VPVPAEREVPSQVVEGALSAALEEAGREGVAGRELTPYLLRRIAERSGGATLRANVTLLEQNARVAAEIAVALAAG
jgi:pseudouridine-5'-phosphate glycosidase